MKKFLMMMFTMLMGLQSVQAMNVDEFIDKNIAPFTDAIANFVFSSVTLCGTKVPVIILWILAAGFFFTIYFKGIAIWGFKHAIDNIVKKPEGAVDECGDVSSFQALATALSGTIGIGSIAGVALSISFSISISLVTPSSDSLLFKISSLVIFISFLFNYIVNFSLS